MLFCRVGRSLFILLTVLLLCACGGLGGEPRIVATVPPATPAPTEVGHPLVSPDLASGAQIYAERCTRCHGDTGRGDGELIGTAQNQVANVPPDFTDLATTANQTPLEWFNTITNGRIDQLMPPWRDALTESQRWDVAMYTYMMHVQPEVLARGEAIAKDGALSVDDLPSQTDLVMLIDAQLPEAFGLSGTFLSSLTESMKQDLSAYLRSLSVSNTQVLGQNVASEPASTPEVQSTAAVTGTVSGQVTNGTAGSTVPSGLSATLHIFDDQLNDDPHETTVSDDGTFTFQNIPLVAERSYIVTVTYQDRIFPSAFLAGDPVAGKLELPVTIYDITSDASVIRIVGWVTQMSATEGALQIAQVISYTNDSDKAFSADQLPGDDRYASVQVTLPLNAQVLSVAADDQRYVVSQDGRTVVDTAPVLPGEQHIAHVVYSLPYSGDLSVDQPMSYSVQGPVRLLVTPQSVKIVSDQLPSLGAQALSGVNYQAFGSDLTIPAGSVLQFTVLGNADGSATAGTTNLLPIILIVVGVIAIGLALYLSLKGRNATGTEQSSADSGVLMDGLIRQIAELDTLHTNGELDETTYQNRRAKLKARLAELMDEE